MLLEKLTYKFLMIALIILAVLIGNVFSVRAYDLSVGVSSYNVNMGESVYLWASAPWFYQSWADIRFEASLTRVELTPESFFLQTGYFIPFAAGTYSITFSTKEAYSGIIYIPETITIIVRDNSGYVKGCIIDSSSGAPISGVRINGTGSASARSETDGCYKLPDSPGDYTVTAEIECYESSSKEVSITSGNITSLNISLLPKIISKGDVNGDGKIDLQDAILALRTLTGISQTVCKGADVNNDNRIGLEETIYVLQRVAESRMMSEP